MLVFFWPPQDILQTFIPNKRTSSRARQTFSVLDGKFCVQRPALGGKDQLCLGVRFGLFAFFFTTKTRSIRTHNPHAWMLEVVMPSLYQWLGCGGPMELPPPFRDSLDPRVQSDVTQILSLGKGIINNYMIIHIILNCNTPVWKFVKTTFLSHGFHLHVFFCKDHIVLIHGLPIPWSHDVANGFPQALGNKEVMPRGTMRWNPASKGPKYPHFEAMWVPWRQRVAGKKAVVFDPIPPGFYVGNETTYDLKRP